MSFFLVYYYMKKEMLCQKYLVTFMESNSNFMTKGSQLSMDSIRDFRRESKKKLCGKLFEKKMSILSRPGCTFCPYFR